MYWPLLCGGVSNKHCLLPFFHCICENKGADQLRGNREADQQLCFRYTDSTTLYFLNPKFQDSSHLLCLYSPVYVRPGQKPRRPVFSKRGSYEPLLDKPCLCAQQRLGSSLALKAQFVQILCCLHEGSLKATECTAKTGFDAQ